MLTEAEKQAMEVILVENHDILASLPTKNGHWDEHGVQRGTHTKTSQILPMPIRLKANLIVMLALMNKGRIIRGLNFSKYASPTFAERKHNGMSSKR